MYKKKPFVEAEGDQKLCTKLLEENHQWNLFYK